jgi:hypothetical protein
MNITTKNYIIQKAISQLKDYNILYYQNKKYFIIEGIRYSFKEGLIKIKKLLIKRGIKC